jgi:hypothetical protein
MSQMGQKRSFGPMVLTRERRAIAKGTAGASGQAGGVAGVKTRP